MGVRKLLRVQGGVLTAHIRPLGGGMDKARESRVTYSVSGVEARKRGLCVTCRWEINRDYRPAFY